MSIKKLFESTNTNRNYLSDTNEKDAFSGVESAQNVSEIATKQERFVPQVNYSQPRNFAKYGSARLYYNTAVNRILDYYPYDGSEYEIAEFHNKSLDIENYIFDNEYPRTNGYALISANGWGSRTGGIQSGFGLPTNQEYIAFTGGPHTITSSVTAGLFPDDSTSKRNYANVYDTDIYTSAGLESDYASGSRESNLKCDFDRGVTVEFWMKKDAFAGPTKSAKEVIFDIWNGREDEDDASLDYGRINLIAATSPSGDGLLLTVRSGSTGWRDQAIGSNDITADTLADGTWKHYALSLQNTGSQLVAKLYVTGALDSTTVGSFGTLGELPSKTGDGAMGGRIGALIAPQSGAPLTSAGMGKLSASIDEFRFWKATRNPQEIGEKWFSQVRGGTNTDISNTTLGVYYKFNEGITGDNSIDNSVLDYSGRISNGNWIGYDSYSRSTNSAIVEASASATEYKDPIIRDANPNVASLKSTLQSKGAEYDYSNNSAFKTLIPSWVAEEQDSILPSEAASSFDNNIEMVSHIIGAYFDKLRLQIKALPTFRNLSYTSASQTPFPFAQHLPQSLGLYMPELFIDSTVLERFMNRDPTMLFEGDLNETKNLIYLNIYNNLTDIYKSKGTEKAIRNVYRCFNLDDSLVRLNVYAQNETYELKDNLRQTLLTKKTLNLNGDALKGGVVYQSRDVAQVYYLLTSDWWSRQGYTAKSSLVGWWKLDTNISSTGDAADSSGNGHTATPPTGYRPGWPASDVTPSVMIQDNSNEFSNSVVVVPSAAALSFGGAGTSSDDSPFSIQARINASTLTNDAAEYDYIVAKADRLVGGNFCEYSLYAKEKKLIFKLHSSSGNVNVETVSDLSTAQWYDLVVTYEPPSGGLSGASTAAEIQAALRIYLDGVEVATTGTTTGYNGSNATGEDVGIGDLNNPAGGVTYPFDGYIADVAIWNSTITAEGVKALYNARDGVGITNTAADSSGYISGSDGAGLVTGSNVLGYEFPYGFTAEADIIFPIIGDQATSFTRDHREISLFNMCTADTGSIKNLNGLQTGWVTNYSTPQPDFANFQVSAVKEVNNPTNVYFRLTGANSPHYIPELTSSIFYDVYDDTRWNISVRLKPTDFGTTNMVSGSITNTYKYDLVFQGLNSLVGTIQNSFVLTASLSQDDAHNFLKSAKRLSAGALRTNVTGALTIPSDVLFNSVKYWAKYIDDLSLYQHAYDLDNSGISGSYKHISPLDLNLKNSGSVLNSNMLALDWRFNNVSSSDANGSFFVEDYSSGSLVLRDNYGWVGNVAGYQHLGSGSAWPATSQSMILSKSINVFQFINPEYAVSSDMVKIPSQMTTSILVFLALHQVTNIL